MPDCIPRTPDRTKDSAETDPIPKQKLAAVTRKQNEIESILSQRLFDIDKVKEEFNEYLVRVESLLSAAQHHQDWLRTHEKSIADFRKRVESIIHLPARPASIISGISNTSSARD